MRAARPHQTSQECGHVIACMPADSVAMLSPRGLTQQLGRPVDACFAEPGCDRCVAEPSCAFCHFLDVRSCFNASRFPAYCRGHNDADVMCVGAKTTGIEVLKQMAVKFATAEFEFGRHAGRVAKIHASKQQAD